MIEIFVSKPTTCWEKYQKGQDNFLNYLRDLGINPRTIGSSDYPAKGPLDEVIRLMDECRGAIILGIPQIFVGVGMGPEGEKITNQPITSEWNHIEAALAYDRGFPLLLIHEKGIKSGVFARGAANSFIYAIDMSTPDWNMSNEIRGAIKTWLKSVQEFKPGMRKKHVHAPTAELDQRQKDVLLMFHKIGLHPLSTEVIAEGLSMSVTLAQHAIDQLIDAGLMMHWAAKTYNVTKEGRAYLVTKLLGGDSANKSLQRTPQSGAAELYTLGRKEFKMRLSQLAMFLLIATTVKPLMSETQRREFEFPLQLPELFESRLREVGINQSGIAYIQAADECAHWGGEEPYSEERAEQIKTGAEGSCGNLEKLKVKFLDSKPSAATVATVSRLVSDLGEVEVFELNYFLWQDADHRSEVMDSYYESRAQDVVKTTKRDAQLVGTKNKDKLVYLIEAHQQVPVIKANLSRLHSLTQSDFLKAAKWLDDAKVPVAYEE